MDELPLFPVMGWEIADIPAYDAIFIRLAFLASPLQDASAADPGRRYVFERAQARELIAAIQRAIDRLESAGPQPFPGEHQS